MYIVELQNGAIKTEIHGLKEKLKSGNVVKGINSIDSLSFTMLPFNAGFNQINDFQTIVSVYNTKKKRYEFQGRVLYSKTDMDESGRITKEVTCESYFGFLCDSVQKYAEETNWTVNGLLQHIIDTHNSQVEEYKRFTIGAVTVTDPNDNLYLGIQRENTWKAIEEKLLNKLGGELRFRVVDGVIYLDYLAKMGETRATKIELSRNMKAITKECDPSAYITRLIPLGAKLTKEVTTSDEEGNEYTEIVETEERLDISSVNEGVDYIDDMTAVETYGIHVGYVEFDDVTDANNLLRKGKEWLVENNKVQVKYSITALDLSLLGLDIDDFDVHDYYPIVNPLLGIDDTARITKKNIDICEEVKSTIEVGDNFKTLSDMQIEQAGKVDGLTESVGKIENDYVTNERLLSERRSTNSMIQQSVNRIMLSVEEVYAKSTTLDDFKKTISAELNVLADEISMKFATTTEQITNVDGNMQTKFAQLYKYIQFSGDTAISISSGNSAITLEIDNEKGIVFKKNGVQFGQWDGENFYTGNIVVRVNERAQYGNFAYIPRSDGSLMFLKVSG